MENLSKDVSIVRQSGVKIALEFCKVHQITPTLRELFRLTDIFAQDALMLSDKDFRKQVKKVDEWIITKKHEAINSENS